MMRRGQSVKRRSDLRPVARPGAAAQSNSKKTIVIFCHRFFELRFMVVSRLLQEISERARLVVMLPGALIESFRPFLPKDTEVQLAQYTAIGKKGSVRIRLLWFLDSVLYFTFAHMDCLPNATAEFHRSHHLKWARSMSLPTRIAARAKTLFAKLCSNSRPLRWMLQRLYFALAPKGIHARQLTEFAPDLMVGCSFGMGVPDALFLVEARMLGVPSVTVVQSWDRTSNKGYPTIHPEAGIVWNEIMKRECVVQLEFPPDRVFVVGAPLWDQHFTREGLMSVSEWRETLGISPDRKVVFYACGDSRCHKANLEIIPQIFSLAERQDLPHKVHIVFRLYPLYLNADYDNEDGTTKRQEIDALLARYAGHSAITITRPKVAFDGKNFFPTEEDQHFMLSCLAHCDVALSQGSSQMIEACIFDKPAINVMYGRYRAELYDFDMADFRTEHLLRIYRTDAVYNVYSFEDLIACLASVLQNPDERAQERKRLVDQEAPVNRGEAAKMIARRLIQLAEALATAATIGRSSPLGHTLDEKPNGRTWLA
jgi:hypothetical protein